MNNIAIYPYDHTIALTLLHLNNDYCIQKLISPIGWGYVGTVVETSNGSLVVQDSFDSLENISCVCFTNTVFPLDFDSQILPILKLCKAHNLKVIWFRELTDTIYSTLVNTIQKSNLTIVSTPPTKIHISLYFI